MKPDNLGGTPLESSALHGVNYTPQLKYARDVGEAIQRYLQELKNGRLIARSCHQCGRIMIPPRIFCERCFRPTDEWVYVKDTGKILTFSLSYVTWDVHRLKQPQIPAVIEIDGASPGMGILHLIKKVPPKSVQVGMPVRAIWKPEKKRVGSITDIDHWEALPEAGE